MPVRLALGLACAAVAFALQAAAGFWVAKKLARRGGRAWSGTGIRVRVAMATVSTLAILSTLPTIQFKYGGFKAYGEFIKLNQNFQKARILAGGDPSRAAEYFATQEPRWQGLASQFVWRGTWGLVGYPAADASWEELLSHRAARMAQMLQPPIEAKDFLVEKDKCIMYDFFKRHGLPGAARLGATVRDAFTAQSANAALGLARERAFQEGLSTDDAVFLKACHLTQGSDNGVLKTTVAGLAEDPKVAEWAVAKMAQRPNDNWRPWSLHMNVLLAAVQPGFLVQQTFPRAPPTRSRPGLLPGRPVEAKVEVIWGRAYLAFFHDYVVYALRDGSMETFSRGGIDGSLLHASKPGGGPLEWVAREEFLEPLWQLAEAVAKSIGTEQVRVDVFLDPDNPKGCVINEISLASGVMHRYHAPYMARLWTQGFRERGIEPFNTRAINSDTAFTLYLMSVPAIFVLLALLAWLTLDGLVWGARITWRAWLRFSTRYKSS